MLTLDNQYWKFANATELDEFLNQAIDSNDDYHLSSFGISQRGEHYAYGYKVVKTKFGKPVSQKKQEQTEQVETF